MSSGIIVFIIVFSVLMFLAPLGIWNRLIKINQEQKAHDKEVEKKLNRLVELLDTLTAQSDYTEGE